MTRQSKAQHLTSILFIVISLSYLMASMSYPPGARLIPAIVACATIVVAAFQLLAPLVPALMHLVGGKEDQQTFFHERGQIRRSVVIIGWTLILYLLIFTLGFVVAVPFFMVLFLRLVDRGSWRLTLFMSAGLGGLSYLLMVGLLELAWNEGVLWSLIR